MLTGKRFLYVPLYYINNQIQTDRQVT